MLVAPRNALSYEYSVRHAFCSDYARNKTSFPSASYQYDLQVAYNRCMQNAESLIIQHEQRKRQSAEDRRIRKIEQERRSEEERQQRDAIKRQEEMRKRQEEMRIERQTNDMRNYFY